MKNLFVLLVGINDYQKLSKLNGCIKDINQIDGFINKHCKEFDVHVKRLENAEGTYRNIIDNFRSHLRQAGPEDVAWFHFSGHGSEELCAEEFKVLEPGGKDQTLCCYDGETDEYLADKELAVLLNEVAHQDANGNPKVGVPHIVVSLDCCHSGSGTRSAADESVVKTRNAVTSGNQRTLNSYIDGYYAAQGGNLQIPAARHVVLSACESRQLAGDLPKGGAFTTGLVRALNKTGGKLNYADLFMQARASVKKIRDNQTPQFDTIENFDPYVRFLEGSPEGSADQYEVLQENSKWYVKCGAIHGLPTSPKSPIELDIYDADDSSEPIGSATIKSVGALKSAIDFESSIDVKNFFNSLISRAKNYRGVVKHLPAPPEFVALTGDADGIQTIKDRWDDSKNIKHANGEDEEPTIEVNASADQFAIKDLLNGTTVYKTKVIDGKPATTADHADIVVDSLGKIVKWRRFSRLENESFQSQLKNKVEFELRAFEANGNMTPYTANEIKLYATPENSRGWAFGFEPVVRVKDVSQDLYMYLFFLQDDYAIDCPDGQKVYHPGDGTEVKLWTTIRGFGPMAEGQSETTGYFKCLITTEELDHQQFQQNGLGAHRSGLVSWGAMIDDWVSFTVRVTIAKEDNAIAPGKETETSVAGGALRILPHPAVEAKVSVGHSEVGTRSNDPSHQFARLSRGDFEQMGFGGGTRSSRSDNVLELNQLKISDPSILEENPLDIVLPGGGDDDDGMILPIAFDGEYFRVIGDSETVNGETVVHVRELPDVKQAIGEDGDVKSPFASEMQDRSIFKALKMSFFKLKIGKENANALKWADLGNLENISLKTEYKDKVAEAKNVLVAIHGIAGSGKSMLEELAQSAGEDWLRKYDCVLAYEFESLNTPLEQTANSLATALTEAGFSADDDKNLTMIGDSVGGLVARWYVERSGGKDLVDHCILVGTPHAGSLFGKMEEYRKTAMRWLDLAINFVPNLVPFSGFLLKGLRTAGDLGATLGQLNPESDFIKQLSKSEDPGVQYSIVSGDASDYKPTESGFGGMVAKVRTSVGKIVNRGEAHDLFASVRSTTNEGGWSDRSPQPRVLPTLKCTHFDYMTNSDRFTKED